MLTKNDLILLLSEISESGVNTDAHMNTLLLSRSIPADVIRFISEYRDFEVANFYTLLRKNYNRKKSTLYKNLVRETFDNPNDILITLSSLQLQIMLYANKLSDSNMFLKHSRGEEITYVLNNYYKTYDLIPCMKLLKIIKADLKSFEAITR